MVLLLVVGNIFEDNDYYSSIFFNDNNTNNNKNDRIKLKTELFCHLGRAYPSTGPQKKEKNYYELE